MAKKVLKNVGVEKFAPSSQKFVAFLKSFRETQPSKMHPGTQARTVAYANVEKWQRAPGLLTTDCKEGFGSNMQPSGSGRHRWDPKNFLGLLSG